MNAPETMKLLRRLGACGDARKWVRGKTLSEAWATCERGDWMAWLADRLGVRMTPEAWAEYRRVRAPAWADRLGVRMTPEAWAEYRRVRAPAWAEYERVTATARAEYRRVRATAYRAAIPWEQIERAAKLRKSP